MDENEIIEILDRLSSIATATGLSERAVCTVAFNNPNFAGRLRSQIESRKIYGARLRDRLELWEDGIREKGPKHRLRRPTPDNPY